MCQNITTDQRVEGWRAFAALLAKFHPRAIGVKTAAWVARLQQGMGAADWR